MGRPSWVYQVQNTRGSVAGQRRMRAGPYGILTAPQQQVFISLVLPSAAREAVRLPVRILDGDNASPNGDNASPIPVAKIDLNKPILDGPELKRRNIREDRLPPGSEIRFRELTGWDMQWYVLSRSEDDKDIPLFNQRGADNDATHGEQNPSCYGFAFFSYGQRGDRGAKANLYA
jgi:hypothetical protein